MSTIDMSSVSVLGDILVQVQLADSGLLDNVYVVPPNKETVLSGLWVANKAGGGRLIYVWIVKNGDSIDPLLPDTAYRNCIIAGVTVPATDSLYFATAVRLQAGDRVALKTNTGAYDLSIQIIGVESE